MAEIAKEPLVRLAIVMSLTVSLSESPGNVAEEKRDKPGQTAQSRPAPVSSQSYKVVRITVLYDNYPYKKGLKTGWGFSCLVEGTEKTILFDTGGDGSLLLNNLKELKIDPLSIDAVVLSHIHGDHVGGLWAFLQKNHRVVVYIPKSFPKGFKDRVKSSGSAVVEIDKPAKICEGVHSTGQLGRLIKEQSLIICTE